MRGGCCLAGRSALAPAWRAKSVWTSVRKTAHSCGERARGDRKGSDLHVRVATPLRAGEGGGHGA
jgi:hypothetical protein